MGYEMIVSGLDFNGLYVWHDHLCESPAMSARRAASKYGHAFVSAAELFVNMGHFF